MAIGGTFNNSNNNGENKSNKLWENQYYSRLRIKNADGKLQLSASFRSGLLILSMDEVGENYSTTAVEQIFLSPTKALLLANELDAFMKYTKEGNIDSNKGFGVSAGMGEKVTYIAFHATADNTKMVTIGKINNTGSILEKRTMSFNKDYHYALEWNNVETFDAERTVYDDVELDMLKALLVDFSRSMNGAIAYSTADITRYDLNKVLNKMDPIYDKLGIERKFSNGYSGGSKTNNFLSNLGAKSMSSNSISLDDIGDELMDEE